MYADYRPESAREIRLVSNALPPGSGGRWAFLTPFLEWRPGIGSLLPSILIGLAPLLGGARAAGAEYFVSPSGQASGDGSRVRPLNLAAALNGALAQPGDTFWVMGGEYALGYIATTLHGAAGRPVTVRAVPGQRVSVDGAITLFSSVGYVDFWGMEWKRSDPDRISAQSGFNPTDIAKRNGFNTFVPHVRLINLVIHDQLGAGVYLSPETVGSEVHGCLAYNNGYLTQDVRDGHGYYVRNHGEAKALSDNFAFNGIASGFHIYSEGVDTLNNITLDGNVAFNAGVYAPAGGYRDLLVGGDGGQVTVDNIAISNSFLYYKPGSAATVIGMAQIGRDGVNARLALAGNHFTAGMMLKNWSSGTVTGNRVAASGTLVDHYQNLAGPWGLFWDANVYQSFDASAAPFHLTQSRPNALSFGAWQQVTGFDAASALTTGTYGGVEIYVRPNKYEPGRANLIVYNWARQSTVAVDVSPVLPVGTAYEVRNVQDFFAPPVLSGIYTGESLVLPMTGLTVAKPVGPFEAAAPIGPEFNAFVLVALPSGAPDALTAISGVPSSIPAGTLLANDTQLRAPLTLTAVSGVSARGGTVDLASDQVIYQSAAGFSGEDTFTYTVVDDLGSVGTGLVTMTVGAIPTPTLAWTQPDALVYGQPLTSVQLNPTASAPGTFLFTPALGTVLHAGLAQTLTANFTPADPAKFGPASLSTTIDVAPAPLTVEATSLTAVYGAAIPVLTVSYSGWVNGDTAASLVTPAILATPALAGSPIGTYVIRALGLVHPDYTPVYRSGELNIVPAPPGVPGSPVN